MHTPVRRILFAAAVLVLALAGARTLLAAPPTPVITTPTPVPTPTPAPLRYFERAGADSHISLAFLPMVRGGASEGVDNARPEAFRYVVQPGDTLWSLALDFERDLDTMSCVTSTTGSNAEELTPGREIVVPALDDLCYTVVPGDTLAGIAARHGLTVQEIASVAWNGFVSPPYSVQPRQRVLLPAARPDAQTRPELREVSYASDAWAATEYSDWPYGDGQFIWPVTGPISQRARAGHMALDIAVPVGTEVRAADRGRVVMAGWNASGYGFRVVIDHGIDYVTLYAHLSDIYVEVGQVVGKGQVIGASGANGNVTGPHLHFELRDFGRLVDPLPSLPR